MDDRTVKSVPQSLWMTPQSLAGAKEIGRIFVFDAVSELALLTAMEQGWVESQTPLPTCPVSMCIVNCPRPVGSG